MNTRLLLFSLAIYLMACDSSVLELEQAAATTTVENHLSALSDKNVDDLARTIPDDSITFILPGKDVIYTTKEFLGYHREMFEDEVWSVEGKVLSVRAGTYYGIASAEITYNKEEGRDKPERMIVSFGLQKTKGQWFIIRAHTSALTYDLTE